MLRKRHLYIIIAAIFVACIALGIYSIMPRKSDGTIHNVMKLPVIGASLLPLNCTSAVVYHRIDNVRSITVVALGHARFGDFKIWMQKLGFRGTLDALGPHLRQQIPQMLRKYGIERTVQFSSASWYFTGSIHVQNKLAMVFALADPNSSLFLIQYSIAT